MGPAPCGPTTSRRSQPGGYRTRPGQGYPWPGSRLAWIRQSRAKAVRVIGEFPGQAADQVQLLASPGGAKPGRGRPGRYLRQRKSDRPSGSHLDPTAHSPGPLTGHRQRPERARRCGDTATPTECQPRGQVRSGVPANHMASPGRNRQHPELDRHIPVSAQADNWRVPPDRRRIAASQLACQLRPVIGYLISACMHSGYVSQLTRPRHRMARAPW
jgi:hypothetical protein